MEKRYVVALLLIGAVFVGLGYAHFEGSEKQEIENMDNGYMENMEKMMENMDSLTLEEAKEMAKGMPCEKMMENMDEETFEKMKEMHEQMEKMHGNGMGMMGMGGMNH